MRFYGVCIVDINKLERNREHEKNDPLFTLFKPSKIPLN